MMYHTCCWLIHGWILEQEMERGGGWGGSAKNFMFDRKPRAADCKTREEMFEQDYFSLYLSTTIFAYKYCTSEKVYSSVHYFQGYFHPVCSRNYPSRLATNLPPPPPFLSLCIKLFVIRR